MMVRWLRPLTYVIGSWVAILGCSQPEEAESAPANLNAKSNDFDRCSTRCHKTFAAGMAKVEALDECVQSKCQPPSESDEKSSAAATTKACESVGNGESKVRYAYGPTDACMARSCCSAATACARSADCAGMLRCVQECNGAD